ncbi:hypothetical protein BD626DRAFT_482168 [Schizophyllum amplum]|uniref:Uncharacterized protein n=1 Tax=Schizophyllum amplum TaxID=97359 RepID=A0A550CUV6_9AGAR|nr:hypothetical protein BD626DRAFT_478245 [Auriculariopsis ampla]TRM68576.1 hypothetical protein BD626DRAFT_482168 [Auriculariopsis ampla]
MTTSPIAAVRLPRPRQGPAPLSAGRPSPPYALATTGILLPHDAALGTNTSHDARWRQFHHPRRPNQQVPPTVIPADTGRMTRGAQSLRTCCQLCPHQRRPLPSKRNGDPNLRIPTVCVQLATIDVIDCLQQTSTSSRLERCTHTSRPRSPRESAKIPERQRWCVPPNRSRPSPPRP